MAVTTGQVHKITWSAELMCAWVGPAPTAAEIFFIEFGSADTERDLAFKSNAASLLSTAKMASYPVRVRHPDDGGEILEVSFIGFNISPVGDALHNDFYCVTGSAIPSNVQVVFDSAVATVRITPDLVRPQMALITQLASSVPLGRNQVSLQSPSWTSDSVPVEVSNGPITQARVLYTGMPKDRPFNIVFVANPAIRTEAGGLISDPILANRAGFHSVVGYCMRMLLAITEDLFRQGNCDAQMRFVTIFDPSQGVSDANALAQEDAPNIMETRRDKLNGFVSRYTQVADIVLVMHGSTSHNRASAWFATDDSSKPGTAFTYDGAARTHGQFPSIPGSAALPLDMDQTGITPLHECGHAASDFNNGMITDLYVDGIGGFLVNKKARARNTDPIPPNFANYNGTVFRSDLNRDGLGYPASWTSYHPSLIDATRPNVMDNYWLAFDDAHKCRFDSLAYAWFSDRLRAKLTR